MPRTIAFTHEDASRLEVSGGKGASLARSARALPVPPGLIVTAEAYRAFLEPLAPAIAELLSEAENPEEAARPIQELILGVDPGPAWLKELEDSLSRHDLAERPVAVRSSGTMEDLPGAAFAGQHDTFLGERGAEAVSRAVKRCYASLWNAHAVKYRDRLGLDHLKASMAVVVQRMVEVSADEAAGVAFSVEPVRGDLDTVLINAAFGLGETVVGGEAEVDEYLLSRDGAEDREIRVVHKPNALVLDPDGGTREVELDSGRAAEAAVGRDARADIARLAVQAEHHFGFPQDIEWAISEGELFLLQSRPVTSIAPRWTRDESAERFPHAVTPLTWDLVEAGFHESLRHSFALMDLPPFGDTWFAMRDYYIYGNQTAVELYSGRLPVSMFRDVESIRAALPEIARRYAWVQDLPVQWMRDVDTYLIGIGRLSAEPLEDKSIEEVWDHVLEINDLGATYFLPNIAISLTQRTLYAGLLRLLEMGMPPEQAQQVFDQLLGQTETKTGQVNAELWELAQRVRVTPGLRQWLDAASSAEGRVEQLRKEFPEFSAELDAFLRRHGHRELNFDAYHPTWLEAPHIVLDQIRVLAHSEREERASANQLRAAQAEAERQVLDAVPDDLRYFVQEVIRLARTYTALDDLEHYQTTRLTIPLRRGLRALGRRLVDHGVLDEHSDVYFLHVDALDSAVRDGSASALATLRPQAYEAKSAYESAAASDPDWVYGESSADAAAPGDGSDLPGTAGSPGQVEAEVFVVHSPEDFPLFPAGSILVARTTNPAWTALFYQAAGVITESGGALSHGAVTARELGIPAVMSVRDATRLFENGQRVRLDGSQGIVRLR